MERCPNCHKEIRPGNRFCTQCGARLPDPVAADEVPTDPWPAPGSALAPAWPLPEAVPTGSAAGGAPAVDDEPPPVPAEPTDGPIWAATAGDPPAAAWPAPAAWEGDPAAAGAWATPEQADATVVDAAWRPAAPADTAAGAGAWPAPVEPDRVVPADADAAPADAAPENLAAPSETGAPVAAATGDAAPLERAALLVEELRALLPRLAAAPGDPLAIADRLDAAASEESGRWPDLRAAMEDARANPRDVETVLALSRRVDEVIALIDANDRLAAAAREAAAAIRQGQAGRA